MMAGVGVLLVGVAVVGKQEEVLLDRRIPVRSRPGGVYIYIYLWKGDVSSRAVIRSSALVRSSSHHNIDRL